VKAEVKKSVKGKAAHIENDSLKAIDKVVEKGVLKFLEKKYKHFGDIEGQLWKNNVTYTPRKKKDWLDVSNEDFSLNETIDIMGNRTTPSNFNIFRDSLRQQKQEIHQRMIENLPEMNSNEVDSEGSGSDVEVIPLEFRTALIENGSKLVI